VEAIILAGGRAERLGDLARGKPKALVRVGGRPLASYQVALLSSFGVERVIVSCAAGQGRFFARDLSSLGVEIVAVEEPEPLGRGGGLRLAAAARSEQGPVYAMNGDELLDVDLAALLAHHLETGAAATITVAPLTSSFGVVDLDGDLVTGFREAPRLPYWVNCGLYVLGEDALARLPERGDHERTTFPELAAEGRLRAFRHEGVWLTVNTPKDLRVAEEHVAARPEWLRIRS
jgi:NDP-sugar pyrophosphorylase family protein